MALVIIEALLAALAYAAATHAAYRYHTRHARHLTVVCWAALALSLHAITLLHLILQTGTLVIGLGAALSLFAWQAALLLWLFSLRSSIGPLSLVTYPAAGICAVMGLLVPDAHSAHEPMSWPLQLHIALSMLAYGLLTLGALQAIILSLQHQQLRRRPPAGFLSSLPPLQSMETLLFWLLGAGFAMLSLAIGTGIIFIDHLFGQHLAHKSLLSILAWIVFAVVLFGRWRYGWRGRLAVRGVMIGYIVLTVAYFGSKMVLELILGMHW